MSVAVGAYSECAFWSKLALHFVGVPKSLGGLSSRVQKGSLCCIDTS